MDCFQCNGLGTANGAGYAKYRVTLVEHWYDTVQPESVPSAVIEVEKID